MAHWLAWSCSMTLPTAREHGRVAKALRRMPTVAAAFAAGRLSNSKVREVTRVVDVVDEAQLCELALTATAAQLAVMISAFRSADGRRWPQPARRRLHWIERDDGMVERVRLPKDEAATINAALAAASDQFGTPPPNTRASADPDATPPYSQVDALLDVAPSFLTTAPQDRSGEDRPLVVVHVDADLLADPPALENVPAGTSPPAHGKVCHLQGLGGIEPDTARRLACDATLLGAITTHDGEVLDLGRTRRSVSKAQRRALLIRDRTCQYPGCSQQRHLDAHHILGWAAGGQTDLDNLVLLCRFHHTAVHEGRLRIERAENAGVFGAGRWRFMLPDGTPTRPWWNADALQDQLAEQTRRTTAALSGVDRFDHPDARKILPRWAGEPFDLHECVYALFTMKIKTDQQDQQAA